MLTRLAKWWLSKSERKASAAQAEWTNTARTVQLHQEDQRKTALFAATAASVTTWMTPDVVQKFNGLRGYTADEGLLAVEQQILVNLGVKPGDKLSISQKLDQLLQNDVSFSQSLQQLGTSLMATLADLQAEVTAEKTVIDSAVALLNGLAAQVAALEPNQAAIDQLAADITAQTAELSGAVTANTPPAPATP